MKNIVLIGYIALVVSCATLPNKSNPNHHIYWINSLKADCSGLGPMRCLEIQKGEEMHSDRWHLFYSSIEGFEYEQGYIYKLIVFEEKLPTGKIPADAASIKYTLIEVLKKKQDTKLQLYDIWALENIDSKTIALEGLTQRPQLEMNLSTMKATGNNGCNNFHMGINYVDDIRLEFGLMAETAMSYQETRIPDQFNKRLEQVKSYKIQNLKLYLYDAEKKERLQFKKVD